MKLNREQQAMVEANLGLVLYAINKYLLNAKLEYDDMIAVGQIALCGAVVKYNPDSGIAFSSYAVRAIVNNINREMLPYTRKKRGSDCVTVSFDAVMETSRRRVDTLMGCEPDFQDYVLEKVVMEPVWKMCPTHAKMLFSGKTLKEMGQMEGVTGAAIGERRRKEFEKARSYLNKIGVYSATQEAV